MHQTSPVRILSLFDVAKNHSSYSVTVITVVFPGSQHLITQSSLIKSRKIPLDVSSVETYS